MANKIEQTKGYVFLVGKVFGIDGKEPRKNEYKNTLNIRVNTSKDNSVFATVGGWNNSPLSVKFKAQGMEQADEVPVSEAAEILQDYFHDGDSVLVRASVVPNSFKDGSLDIEVSGIYATKEEIDFEKNECRNEVSISGIVEKEFDGKELSVLFANYKGETITKKLTAEEDIIKEFLSGVNIGDLIPFTLSIINKPIYEIISGGDSETNSRKTLLGKEIGVKKQKRKIVGNQSILLIKDIDVDKIEKSKYSLEKETQDLPF